MPITKWIQYADPWHELWNQVQTELTGLSDSEILRQAIALRAALVAVDADDKRPIALITFVDNNGETTTVDLEAHVGIKEDKVSA